MREASEAVGAHGRISRRRAASMDANGTCSNRTVGDIERFYTPALCVFGTAGNVASVAVFFGTKLRKLSSSFYLGALNVSDSLFLVSLFFNWLNLLNKYQLICKGMTYMTFLSTFMSSWLVVAFTVERFAAVRYPLQRQFVLTVTRAKTVLVVLTFVAAVVYSPYLWMVDLVLSSDSNDTECNFLFEMHVTSAFNIVDTVVALVLPFFVIASLNAAICTTVWQVASVRRTMTRVDDADGRRQRSGDSSQTRVTKMLLVVSTIFLCLNLPSYVARIMVFCQQQDLKTNCTFVEFQHVAYLFFYTNFGINFVLYCVSGQNFRRSLVAMCCRRFRRRPDSTQVTVVSEYNKRSSCSSGRQRTVTLNGFQGSASWKDAHELLPLTK